MIREIKFRGISKDTSKFIQGDLIQNQRRIFIRSNIDTTSEVIPETVGMYYPEMNIYEGDIYEWDDDCVALVIFENGAFRLNIYGLKGALMEYGYDEGAGGIGLIETEPLFDYDMKDEKSIGNIHTTTKEQLKEWGISNERNN